MPINPEVPYNLEFLPRNINYDKAKYFELLGATRGLLGELKGSCRSLPDPNVLIYSTLIKEAVESSKIENIETTVEEALQNQLFPEDQRNPTDSQVLRYRDSVLWASKTLKDWGISSRLIIGIKNILLNEQGRDGYRRLQNHIENKTTNQKVYTPPIASSIPDFISNWENYVNQADRDHDPLIKCAISHYQFEAIHPFEDGNGRTGRILILLQLMQDGLLSDPVLFISGFINKHRPEYYEYLRLVSDGEWDPYIDFMLRAFYHQVKATNELVVRIKEEYDTFLNAMRANKDTRSMRDLDLLTSKLFSFPVVTPTLLANELGTHPDSASRKLQRIASMGLLSESREGKYHIFSNAKLLELLREVHVE